MSNTLEFDSPKELTKRYEQMSYKCGKIMEHIGKKAMWDEWLEDEEDFCSTESEVETFWEDKLKEAWAAKTTHELTPEQRVEQKKMIQGMIKQVHELSYRAGCAGAACWEIMDEGADFCADKAFYWQDQINRLEKIIAMNKAARIVRDDQGNLIAPPALRVMTDPDMHTAGGRVEQHQADVNAYVAAGGVLDA